MMTDNLAEQVWQHVNTAYYKALLVGVSDKAEELGLSFVSNNTTGEPYTDAELESLSLALLAQREAFLRPSISVDDAANAVLRDTGEGFGLSWLRQMLDGLAMRGIYLRRTSGKPPKIMPDNPNPHGLQLEIFSGDSGRFIGRASTDGLFVRGEVGPFDTRDEVLEAARTVWPGIDHIDLPDSPANPFTDPSHPNFGE